jgi:7-dehydrocholesterol reductase
MVHADGSVVQTYQHLRDHGLLEGLRSIWPMPTVVAGKIILGFALFEAALQLLLPGKRFEGPVSPSGNVPVYKVGCRHIFGLDFLANRSYLAH